MLFLRMLFAPILLRNKPTEDVIAARDLVMAAIANSPNHPEMKNWVKLKRNLERVLRGRKDLFDHLDGFAAV